MDARVTTAVVVARAVLATTVVALAVEVVLATTLNAPDVEFLRVLEHREAAAVGEIAPLIDHRCEIDHDEVKLVLFAGELPPEFLELDRLAEAVAAARREEHH